MRISAALVSGLVATSTVGIGLAHMGAEARSNSETASVTSVVSADKEPSKFRFTLPQTYKSWLAQRESVKVCVPLSGAQWEDCLLGHYEAKTSYRLSHVEYKVNRAKKTFTVSYSKITLPKGGDRLTNKDKDFVGVDHTVYCKIYSNSGPDNESEVILCSNGTSY